MEIENGSKLSSPRNDRPGCGTGKCPTFYPLYVQVNMQEPLWNQTMVRPEQWTGMLDGLQ